MIPSKYLFPVITLVLIWVTSLLGVYAYVTVEMQTDDIHINHASISQTAISELELLHDSEIMRYQSIMEDDSKMRFRFSIPVLEEAQLLEDAVLAAFERTHNQVVTSESEPGLLLEQTIKKSEAALVQINELIKNALREHVEDIDLRIDDLENINSHLDEIIEQHVYPYNLYLENKSEVYALIADLELSFILRSHALQKQLIATSSSRTISCFWGPQYFPQLYTNQRIAEEGTSLRLTFGIATYTNTFKPDEIFLINRGDTIMMGPDGTFEVDVPTDKPGVQVGEITMAMRNTLTGEVRSWDSAYDYFVAPK